jgi:hypothetical protein
MIATALLLESPTKAVVRRLLRRNVVSVLLRYLCSDNPRLKSHSEFTQSEPYPDQRLFLDMIRNRRKRIAGVKPILIIALNHVSSRLA